MALETTYDGPPSLEIYQEFVAVSTSSIVDQNAVIVAEHFDIYNHATAADADYDSYEVGTAYSFTWPTGSNPDYASASPYLKNAACVQATVEGTGSGTTVELYETGTTVKNVIKFNTSVDTAFYEPVAVGDVVRVTYTDTPDESDSSSEATEYDIITSVLATATDISDPTVGEFTPVSTLGAGEGGFKLDATPGTYSGSSDRIYYLYIENSDDVSESTYSLGVSVTTSDGQDSGVMIFTETDTRIAMASSGLYVNLDTSDGTSYVQGRYYKLAVTAGGVGELTLVYLSNTLPRSGVVSGLTVQMCKSRDFTLDSDMYTSTAYGVTTSSLIRQYVEFGVTTTTEVQAQVISADIYVDYRDRNLIYSTKIGFVAYGASDLSAIGATDTVDNPLGAMVSAALKGGKGVYFVSVTADTVAAYQKAFQLLTKSTSAYGVVIQSTNSAVIAEALTFVVQVSAASVANYKILYYGMPTDTDEEVVASGTGDTALLATVTDGVLTLESENTSFVTAGVTAGDTVRINYVTQPSGEVTYDTYTVSSVIDDYTLSLTDSTLDVVVAKTMQVWRTLEGTALLTALKNRCYTSNHRAYCVFGDGLTINGIEDAPAWMCAALPAGMRAGEYAQRPISNLAYDGVTGDPKLGLTTSDLRELAGSGVWILDSSADGSSVYNYHQLSTDMTSKTLQEQSYTTNFDNISMGMRALLAPYYGNANISTAFLSQQRANIDAFLINKTKNAPTVTIGPQLISYSDLSITQDTVNRDQVYITVDYNMPAPFNHVTVTQRLL